MTTYLRITWTHTNPDDPVELFSEVDDDGWETRKVEIYADGRIDLADDARSTGTTGLSEVPMPTLEEISAPDEFEAWVISREEFESTWERAVARADHAESMTQAILSLLHRAGNTEWDGPLNELAKGLRETQSDPAARQSVVRSGIRLLSGGMGSFQDLVLQDEHGMRPENDELEAQRSELFRSLKDLLE